MSLSLGEQQHLTHLVVKHGLVDGIMAFVTQRAIVKIVSKLMPILPTQTTPLRVLRLDRQLPRYEPKLLPQYEHQAVCICEQCTLQRFGFIFVTSSGIDYSFNLIRKLVCLNVEYMPIERWRINALFATSNVDMFAIRDSLVAAFQDLVIQSEKAKQRLLEFDSVIRRFNEQSKSHSSHREQRTHSGTSTKRGKRRKHTKRSSR